MHYCGICVAIFYLWEPQFHPEQKGGKTRVRRAISLTWDRNKTRPSAHLVPLKSLLKRLCCVNYGKLSVLVSSGCYNNNDIDWMAEPTDIYFSCFWTLGDPRSRCWPTGSWWGPSFWFAESCLLDLSSHVGESHHLLQVSFSWRHGLLNSIQVKHKMQMEAAFSCSNTYNRFLSP